MWKRISSVVIPTIVAAVLIWLILARVWDDLAAASEHIVPAWILFAAVLYAVFWFVRGFRYKEILQSLGTNVSVVFSAACIYLSQTANILLPARLGDLTRMLILKHERQTPFTNSLTSLIAERVYDIIIIALLGLCTLPFIISLIPTEYEWFIWLIVLVLICGALGVLFLFLTRRLHAENKILAKVLEIFAQFRAVSASIQSLGILSLTSAVIWAGDILVCWIVACMFGVEISFMLVVLAVVIGNLVKAVPITPGGIGTYELALVVVFQIGGVPAATATLIAVIDHLIKNGVTLLGGVMSLYGFGSWAVSLLKRLAREDRKNLEEE